MGMFTTVFKERRCVRCGGEYLCDFQIKTSNDACEGFRDGDLVSKKFGPRGKYAACFSPLCNICVGFLNREHEVLGSGTRNLVFQMGYEIRQSGAKGYIFKDGRRVAEIFPWEIVAEDLKSKDFRRLEKAVVGYWTRQIRAANAGDYIGITCKSEPKFAFIGPRSKRPMEYRVTLHNPRYSKAAEVTIGKRFKVKIVDTGGKDPFHFLLERAKLLK